MSMDLRLGGTTTSVAVTSNSAAGPTMGAQTQYLRVAGNIAFHLKVGSGAQTATSGDMFVPANWESFFIVNRGETTAVLQAATNGLVTSTNGTVWFTEGV